VSEKDIKFGSSIVGYWENHSFAGHCEGGGWEAARVQLDANA
jgi:hypothetical protein